ncbi:MAG TPA: PhoH family protein [Rickettsiales bacterium]|nr:PhoH family protein [Rickettsiales bacterium]
MDNNSKTETVSMQFANNALLPTLYGEDDKNLVKLEKSFGVVATSRGNMLSFSGAPAAVQKAQDVIMSIYSKLENGLEVGSAEVDAAIRMSVPAKNSKRVPISTDIFIKTQKKTINPYSQKQVEYIDALQKHDMVFALGPAGTGKTYLAVAHAVSLFLNNRIDRIILSRPAVEAGEKLGFLPGDLKEKIDPYLRPLYDALYDTMPAERVARHVENGEIEIAPLAFMRGRTLANACIILDEAQNTTPTQMKMFLTRLGENSRMIITGDLSQTDLPRDVKSGLADAVKKVEHIEGIKCIRFGEGDVVRHTLAAKIVQAYDEWEKKKRNGHA